ncbi:MAG: histidinol-phosphate transaminase [Euryarchaeota archaeon]|nr:histidinol-phosphate transaminase [Euryarchaeota archaeon]
MKDKWIRTSLTDVGLYYSPTVKGFRMDNNANLFEQNPVVKEVLAKSSELDLHLYPTTYSDDLRKELAGFYGLDIGNFVAGNGSDEMLDVCFKALLNLGESVVVPHPTYALHPFFIKVNGGKMVQVDLDEDFQLDPAAMNRAKGKIVLLSTPNNPTGNSFRPQDVKAVIEGQERPVIVDEAYGEFSDHSFIPLVNEYENLIVTRTFSKAYGLAGFRIGYAVSNPSLANVLLRAKTPLSLNILSEKVAIAALARQDFVAKTVEAVKRERGALADGLRSLGFKVFPSDTNFIMAKSPIRSERLVSALAQKGILIRDFGKVRGLEDCVRTTVGTGEIDNRLLEKLKEVLDECR